MKGFLAYIFCLGLIISFLPKSIGQIDSIRVLEEVRIEASQHRESGIGSQIIRWNKEALSALVFASVADLLENESNTFIKSYGLGSLATSSIRGGSAGHSLMLWNGIPISSPMLGQLDLSLLPLNASEEVYLEKGGNSVNWGSGAIGGVIGMNNKADFQNSFELSNNTLIGNWGQLGQNVGLKLGNPKFQLHSKFSQVQAQNDFQYLPAPGLEEVRQSNAALFQQNFLQDIYWKVNKKHQLSLHYWRQFSDREIPPTLVQNRSLAHQDDLSQRFLMNWKNVGNRYRSEVKAAFFEEELNYFDDLIGLASESRFKSFWVDAQTQYAISPLHSIALGTTGNYTEAWSGGYRDGRSEWRSALFASWKYNSRKLGIQLGLRQAWIAERRIAPIPHMGIQLNLSPTWQLKMKVSRNFRAPTLNDRFWSPGGNPELKAESGWSEELGLTFKKQKSALHFESSLTTFNRQINNWIMWTVREGENFWSAQNINRVWSRGIEARFSMTHHGPQLSFQLKGGYDYVLSTNQVALRLPSIAAGEQLFYTPRHQAFSLLSINHKQFSISYRHHFASESQGLNEDVPAFQTADANISYRWSKANLSGSVDFRIQNIWDARYFIIERRIMPGRNFQLRINFTLKSNIKE
ncbi:MAG: TonB-dependent receptor [Bacteroidota bacterium]